MRTFQFVYMTGHTLLVCQTLAGGLAAVAPAAVASLLVKKREIVSSHLACALIIGPSSFFSFSCLFPILVPI